MKETWDAQTNEALCIEYQETKSDTLYEYFLSRNIGLIMDYLGPIIRKHPDQKEELVQTCKVAMWEAMNKYNPEKEVKFTTYCHYFFKKNVWHHWHSQYSVHLPINLMTKLDEVREKVPYAVLDFESLDKPISAGDDSGAETTLEEFIAADQPSPEEVAIEHNRAEQLLKILDKLSPRESKCLQMYYGLNGYAPHTLQQIGNVYNVSRECIRQVLEKALKKVKRYYLKDGTKIEDL